MKSVVTCDDVFDTLTREPFPSGSAEDEFVESHLAVCHECRQLAEAFRPAVGLFHESMLADLDPQLPSYRGRLGPIVDSPPRLERPLARPAWNSIMWTVLAITASVLLVGSAVLATLSSGRGERRPTATGTRVRIDNTLLAALEVPRACLTDTVTGRTAFEFVCCTKCHRAASRVASTRKAVLKSSAACVACHDTHMGQALSVVVPRPQDRVPERPSHHALGSRPPEPLCRTQATVSRSTDARRPIECLTTVCVEPGCIEMIDARSSSGRVAGFFVALDLRCVTPPARAVKEEQIAHGGILSAYSAFRSQIHLRPRYGDLCVWQQGVENESCYVAMACQFEQCC